MALESKVQPWMGVVAAVVLTFLALFPYRHFAGDDAYISFRFARNFAEGAGFAFNPGEPTYGSTSPLWIFLMAGLHRLGLSIVDASHLLDAVFSVLTAATFWHLCRSYLRHAALWFIAVALLVFDPWFARWCMSGMENPGSLFFLCAALWARLKAHSAPGWGWLSPVFCGFGLLTRPEFAVLSAVLLLHVLLFDGPLKKSFVRAFAYGLVIVAVFLPWLVYSELVFGSIVPNTVTAKMGAGRLVALDRTIKYFLSFFVFELVAAGACLLLVRHKLWAAVLDRDVQRRWFLPVAWSLTLPAFYITGGAPVAGRYLMFGLPAYLLVGLKAWDVLLSERARWRWAPAAVGAMVLGSFALVGFVQYRYCWYVTRWVEGMDPRMIQLGKDLNRKSQPGDVIATDQIGVVGYFSERKILDMAGLVSPEVQHYNRIGDGRALLRYVQSQGPSWFITTYDKQHLVDLVPEYASLTLDEVYSVQREGAGDAGVPIDYKLYRTNWPSRRP